MIPKIIHYCWFGSKEIPAELQHYIDGWKKYFPDYTYKLWNESNIPEEADFLRLPVKYGKWALVSDYIRFYALYHEGGIYFDTDIEVIKPFDRLLQEQCFIGFQHKWVGKNMLNGAVVGAEKHNSYIGACLQLMTRSFYYKLKPLIGPTIVSEIALRQGVKKYEEQYVGTTLILPMEAFYPYEWDEEFYPECVKENTYTIHHWQYSWKRKKGWKGMRKGLSYKTERRWFMLKHRLKGTYSKLEKSMM